MLLGVVLLYVGVVLVVKGIWLLGQARAATAGEGGIRQGIATAWVFGFLLLEGELAF